MIRQIIMGILVVFALFGISGCATSVVATGAATTAYVINQENSVTQQAKDMHIKTYIKDKLLQKKLGYLKDIEVNVVNSEVLLLGIVSSPKEKREIAGYAEGAKFVKRVYNKLVIDEQYSVKNYLNDALIANAIRSRMVFSKDTYLSKVNIEVFNNVVYVFGLVGTDEEKYFAEKIARTGKGVLNVFSFIRVERKPVVKKENSFITKVKELASFN